MVLGENMNKYYISFARNHCQHYNDILIDNHVLVMIKAENYDDAFAKAKNLFGNKWSMLYYEEEITPEIVHEYWSRGIIQIE